MKETTFGAIKIGQSFYVNDSQYVKLKLTKISCCKSINCQQVANATKRAFFKDSTIVKVIEDNG
jgi:hypothetical protein